MGFSQATILTADQKAALDANATLNAGNAVGDAAVAALNTAKRADRGHVAAAELVNAIALYEIGNTISIGAVDIFTAVDGSPTGKQFDRSGSLDEQMTSIETAINTEGTEDVLAWSAGGGSGLLVLFNADSPGGTKVVGPPGTLALATVISGSGTALWSRTDLDESGKAVSDDVCSGRIVLSTEIIAAAVASSSTVIAVIPFALDATAIFKWAAYTSSGDLREDSTDFLSMDTANKAIKLNSDGAVHFNANEEITFTVVK